ncbi:phage major capsid protein, HK97 family [Amycolatopsis lurida]|uniref:Phage capsid-like C-terminal domain-containing protein n=1 Tax=Amycolatopsis lurida NRRL 2430 TaxID=1460371 RepID=A0A2P2FWB1_AMYLU|nr:phage major capsid protein [Amycolatopsis lurida]KFU81010.1 hypothetical protein BB31_11555 [Amycolatopsis lurida NRRL 2430]SED60511.1 phage major capsid protein, HK97 family [Amycolatopsis lurida]
MTLEEMRARLEVIETERRELHTSAGENALTDEQQTRWDALDTEETGLRSDVQAAETAARDEAEAETRAARVTASRARYGARMGNTEDPLGEPDALRGSFRGNPWDLNAVNRSLYQETPARGGADLAARAMAAVEHCRGVNDASKQRITQLLEGSDFTDDEEEGRSARKVAAQIIATSSPEYMRAWSKAFKTGMRNGHPDVEALGVLQRAASLTDAAGGYAVPLPVDPTLILNSDGTVSPIRQIATNRTIVTDKLRTVNATAVTASYDAEATEVSDDTPTWANRDIDMHMARAFIPHSIEIGMDYPNFTQDVAFLLATAKRDLENNKFVLGNGTTEPRGIVTALTGTAFELTSTTADTFAMADVYKVDDDLPENFADTASWIGNKKIFSAIRQAGGANLDDFWANAREGLPARLLDHPLYRTSAMDGVINATQENRVLVLGDFRFFWVVDRVGFSIELIPHLFHTGNNRPSGQRGVFAFWRNGSDSVLDRAFRMLNVT